MDRRSKRTIQNLKDAFAKLLSEKSFDEITVTEITSLADVSRKTFYIHYTDKYELIDELSEQYLKELDTVSHSPKEISSKERLNLWLNYITQNKFIFNQLLTSDNSYSFRNKFLQYLFKGLQRNPKIKNESTELYFLCYGILGVVEGFITNQIKETPAQIAKRVDDLTEGKLEH
ncbi:TetR/AcrR family transcriptional regulator [Pediococcus claussenii]|uniref:Transcriptional regulator, TetR family n=1 Tax=Pediococcus claussenii (strain ATCC BAA-344 / DSM 14800 / JCM 18046 / KCTC 3811 / LMG 21948 / P06) TaxID=701521 RepID=G8PAY4_PEDCP|nr:TetR/AcrR family transcriptional regulator [Pediococcus claussenii]AEV95852.1 Transcriptional regulator, TetR family [Pediococcus claussenii ATCC BAA-344]ANZ69348.1 hypothetical protein AYR57_03085 [Pediococcus claussenii]ANZ71168.1 hypothetical protein AYR58_03100 [Pediococcus claussenii]KRN20459.1 hypothetical protein IV79_GL000514 [Pediococcus claussenii]